MIELLTYTTDEGAEFDPLFPSFDLLFVRLSNDCKLRSQATAILLTHQKSNRERSVNFLSRLTLHLQELKTFGPRILLRHVARLTRAETSKVLLPGVGLVHFRPRESDAAVFVDIFGSPKYAAFCYPEIRNRIEKTYRRIFDQGGTPVVIDAGANIGAASLWFRRWLPRAAIVAIEPDSNNLKILKRNLANLADVHVLDYAVGSAPGFVEVEAVDLSWSSRTTRSPSGVKLITVEEALAFVPRGELLVVKIDIEGFEHDLFSQNTDWVDRAAMIIVEPHDWMLPTKQTSRPMQREMGRRDFDMILDGENIIYVKPESGEENGTQ